MSSITLDQITAAAQSFAHADTPEKQGIVMAAIIAELDSPVPAATPAKARKPKAAKTAVTKSGYAMSTAKGSITKGQKRNLTRVGIKFTATMSMFTASNLYYDAKNAA